MAEKSKAFYEFKKQVEALKKFRGRGTELVSVYVTPGYPLHEIAAKLRDEYGQASNIKSKSTQKNVQAALERILNHLKLFKKTPENGFALFAGNISEKEGKVDVELFVVEPPTPLHTQFYRCESTFVIAPLEELLDSTETYGLVVLDGKEATVAVLHGKKINVIKQLTSTAHQKVSKGGQCVHESTRIEMADGSQKAITHAFEQDEIASTNVNRTTREKGQITDVFRKKVMESVELTTASTRLTVSAEHRVFVQTPKGIHEIDAGKLQPGMNILRTKANTKALNPEPITKITKTSLPPDYFMDVEVHPHSAYFANGILVHNSAARYSRLHTEAVEYYYTRIGEAMESFLNVKNLKGVIVGGPGPAKDDFIKQAPFNYQLKVLGVVDTGYTDEYGLRELLEKSSDIMAEQEAVKEKKMMDEFMREVSTGGLAAYGLTDLQAKLQVRQIATLLVSEDLVLKRFDLKCSNCGKTKTVYGETFDESECSCGGKFRLEKETDALADLLSEAEAQNVPVEIISKDTAEGAQFHATFKGLGAFLRYK